MWFVSHHWPGITPFNVNRVQAKWWAYYVRAAKEILEKQGAGRG